PRGHTRQRNLLAAAQLKLRRLDEAWTILERSERLDTDSADTRALKGLVRKAQGRYAEAYHLFKEAIEFSPTHFDSLHNGAVVATECGETEQAEVWARSALSVMPDHAESIKSLARILIIQRRAEEARGLFDRLQALMGNSAEVETGYGACALLEHRPAEAIGSFERALKILPGYATALSNLGIALRAVGRPSESVSVLEQATALAPDNPENFWNLSLAQLSVGAFEAGWKNYEVRYAPNRLAMDRVKLPGTEIPMLGAQEAVKGKIVAVLAEQGLGDFLQFCRYVELLRAEGARVVAICPDALVPLIQTLPWLDSINNGIPRSGSNIDAYVFVMSLPYRYGSRLDNVPCTVPYLAPCRPHLEKWAHRFASSRFKIGLVWAGRPTHGNDFHRSMSTAHFSFLSRFADQIEVFSLQMGERADDPAPDGLEFVRLGGDIVDFADSAAIVSHLDLLISIDSSPVHLAGALGIPCWVLLSMSADFRWLVSGEASPWYPSMRLFRQSSLDDWDEVVKRLENALEDLLAGGGSRSKPPIGVSEIDWTAGQFVPAGLGPQLRKAIELQKAGDDRAAADIYQWILRFDPYNQDALRNLAVAFRRMGDLANAKDTYTKALERYPKDAILLANACNLLADLDEFESVLDFATRAAKLDDSNAGVWYMLAQARDRLGIEDGGIAAIERALALAPDRPDYKVLKALIIYKSGDYERSEALAQEIIRSDSRNADAWLIVAQIRARRREFAAALEAYSFAERLKPDNSAIFIGGRDVA
ncbi:hypothetical protein EBZ70_11380, partial [bacterium]|nr:hypothetical protein [bacterium]